MWTVSKSEIADLLKLDLLARLREVQEKVALLERTRQQSFEEFEQEALHGEEDFAQWDDYIEWKAYRRLQRDIQGRIEALRRGNFEVA